jgi:hypothetical protein
VTPGFGAFFGSSESIRNVGHGGEPRSAVLNNNHGDGRSGWHSFGSPGGRAVSPEGRSSGGAIGEWHSFGPRVDGARPEMARNASGGWRSFGNGQNASVLGAMVGNRQARNRDFASYQRTITGPTSAGSTRQVRSISASAQRSTPSFPATRGLSNFRDFRFGGSAFGSNTQTRFSGSRLRDSSFDGPHRFHSDGASFGRGTSFDESGFLFAADLFSSVLDFAGFGLRGLGLLGAGLGQFAWNAFPQLGFGWLFGQEFGSEPAARSPYGATYQYGPWSCTDMGFRDVPYDSPLLSAPCSTEYPGSRY